MLQRAGMREGGKPLPQAFPHLTLSNRSFKTLLIGGQNLPKSQFLFHKELCIMTLPSVMIVTLLLFQSYKFNQFHSEKFMY